MSLEALLITILLSAFAFALWANGGYFLFLCLLELLVRPVALHSEADFDPPRVSIVVIAHNEEKAIGARLSDAVGVDYPPDKLEIIVASDGSSDATVEIASSHTDPRVRVLDFPTRRGKALVANDAVASAKGDWVVFTDADTRFAPDLLRAMLPHFADKSVGVVDGQLVCANEGDSTIAKDVGLYWRYESALKDVETRLGCLVSTFGPCTAIRRTAFMPLMPTEDVDFTTPLDAIVQGYRVVHERSARAYDVAQADSRTQLRARARMVTKNLPGTLRKLDRRLLRRPLVLLSIVSHKLLRWLTPLLLLVALAANVLLAVRGRFIPLLLVQLFLYALAIFGGLAGARGRHVPIISSAWSFLVANAGFMLGLVNSMRGVKISFYEPYRRSYVNGDERR